MDVARFLADLPTLFDDFPRSPLPLDRSLQRVCETVEGLSEENNLALLALSTRHLGEGECYLEAGSYRGRSVIAATLAHPVQAIAVDDFSREDASRERLEHNLELFGVASRVLVLEGDTVAVLDAQSLPPVGVYYYDAAHGTEATLAGLRSAIRHLAEHALIVIDDSDWTDVCAASEQFVAETPGAELALRIDGRARAQSWWWHGMDLVEWSRPAQP